MAADPVPPPPPQRRLDVVAMEGLDDLVETDCPSRELLKSRDFPELYDKDVKASDVRVVLYDAFSMDSFAACLAARLSLGDRARYVGVTRSDTLQDLDVEVAGEVVAMLGVCWTLEAMHELVRECDDGWLLVFETHASVVQELQQFNYPSAVLVLELGMSAGALAWNFFHPGDGVPALFRAIEDAELGRSVLRNASDFAMGYQEALSFDLPREAVPADHEAFQEFELKLEGGGRAVIEHAIEAGRALEPEIQHECQLAASSYTMRTMVGFPAWRCALYESNSPNAGRIAEHLAAQLAQDGGEGKAHRCFGAVYQVRGPIIRVILRSLPAGPEVSEIAASQEDGCGRPTRAFFCIAKEEWDELWVQPLPILWDAPPTSAHSLDLRRGDLVTVARMGERFRESPADEWSWGYKTSDPTIEGWIPTLAHTLFVATRSAPSAGHGIHPVEEGDLIMASGQQGDFVWGWSQKNCSHKGWIKRGDGILQRVHAVSMQAAMPELFRPCA